MPSSNSSLLSGVPIILLLVCTSTYAQIYKWVDEDGIVHYSDKKMDEGASTVEVSSVGMPQLEKLPDQNIIDYSGNAQARKLYYSAPQISLENSNSREAATFYFGKDCIAPTSISWDRLNKRYGEHVSEPGHTMALSLKQLRNHGYRFEKTPEFKISHTAKKNRGYVLEATIVEFDIDTCANHLTRAHTSRYRKEQKIEDNNSYSQNLDDFTYYDFRQSQARMKIQWTIKDPSRDKPLLVTLTEGISEESIKEKGKMNEAIRSSFKNAIERLFSQEQLVNLLHQNRNIETPRAPEEESHTGVFDFFSSNYQKKSKFVEVLGIAAPLRIMITEHYVNKGTWPDNISQLGIDPDFRKEGLIAVTEIVEQGIIRLNVEPEFGEGAKIWIVPEDKQVLIDWSCKTNIPQKFVTANCETL